MTNNSMRIRASILNALSSVGIHMSIEEHLIDNLVRDYRVSRRFSVGGTRLHRSADRLEFYKASAKRLKVDWRQLRQKVK